MARRDYWIEELTRDITRWNIDREVIDFEISLQNYSIMMGGIQCHNVYDDIVLKADIEAKLAKVKSAEKIVRRQYPDAMIYSVEHRLRDAYMFNGNKVIDHRHQCMFCNSSRSATQVSLDNCNVRCDRNVEIALAKKFNDGKLDLICWSPHDVHVKAHEIPRQVKKHLIELGAFETVPCCCECFPCKIETCHFCKISYVYHKDQTTNLLKRVNLLGRQRIICQKCEGGDYTYHCHCCNKKDMFIALRVHIAAWSLGNDYKILCLDCLTDDTMQEKWKKVLADEKLKKDNEVESDEKKMENDFVGQADWKKGKPGTMIFNRKPPFGNDLTAVNCDDMYN